MGEVGTQSRPKLITPYCPEYADNRAFLHNDSADMKRVSDYSGLDFLQVECLEIFDFWGLLHDAVVWDLSKTESGRDYLESAYNHARTEPDIPALRAQFGGKNG